MSSSPARDDKPAPAKKPAPRPRAAAAKPPADHKFDIGDIVLARLRGYPPWREYRPLRAVPSADRVA